MRYSYAVKCFILCLSESVASLSLGLSGLQCDVNTISVLTVRHLFGIFGFVG